MATNRRRTRGHDRIEAARVAKERAARRRQRMPYMVGGIAVLVVVLIGIAVLVSTSSDKANVTTGPSATTATTAVAGTSAAFTYGTTACPPATPPSPPTLDFSGSGGFKDCLKPGSSYVATFDTSAGEIKVQLDTTKTPGTANNFMALAGYGYYNNTKLFRTDTSIGIIQGGSPHTNSASDAGPGFTINDEGGKFTYTPGQLVMARTSGVNSASAQFFFTVDDKASALDAQGTYVVFGNVLSGLDVLQQILATNVAGSGGLGGSPNPPVTINSVNIGVASLVDGSNPTG